jgi:branched-chain amino acid transport system ATP-binding protein
MAAQRMVTERCMVFRGMNVANRMYMMRSGKVVLDKPAADVDIANLHDLYFALEA